MNETKYIMVLSGTLKIPLFNEGTFWCLIEPYSVLCRTIGKIRTLKVLCETPKNLFSKSVYIMVLSGTLKIPFFNEGTFWSLIVPYRVLCRTIGKIRTLMVLHETPKNHSVLYRTLEYRKTFHLEP